MRIYSDYHSLKYKTIYWGKHLLSSTYVYSKPMKTPIAIFSSRRSGSTLLAQVIGSEEGINVSDQPFDLWHYNPYLEKMPRPYLNKFIDFNSVPEKDFYNYSSDLFSGKKRVYTNWRIFHADYHFVVDRLSFKILNAKYLMDWFSQNFDLSIVYQIRHPIAYALSVMKLGWGCTAEAFLYNDDFSDQYLTPETKRNCLEIIKNGTPLQKHVLEWGLENKFPLSIAKDRDWLTISYEELVSKPKQAAGLLASKLDLTNIDLLAERISQPSVSTTASSQKSILEYDPQNLIHKWMKKVDKHDAKDAINILNEQLNINTYSWETPFPEKTFLNFD